MDDHGIDPVGSNLRSYFGVEAGPLIDQIPEKGGRPAGRVVSPARSSACCSARVVAGGAYSTQPMSPKIAAHYAGGATSRRAPKATDPPPLRPTRPPYHPRCR